ncbi:processed acidic surface protein [Metabacillus fastidiosus]|uniref:processed acidic surface protein n=1 Tax=Metabacillus fastidiosus TaxID=1458 RepID=UPI000826C21F|nr:processed acidic surface protein [Metabacillus fastidiosus]MED4463602.1 processed acidic surface protein [Metabacillus fastidiosus]
MKKLICSILLLLILFQYEVSAAPSSVEVNKLLQEIGWTNNDLQRYLDFYEVSLEDYATIDDLKNELGTPITESGLNALFSDYQMSRQDVNDLFSEFDDSLENYFFIEEVEETMDFYLNYDENMEEYNEFLSMIGLTEEEIERLVNHFTALDEATLEREMEAITSRLDSFLNIEDITELTQAQQDELVSILQDTMKAFHLETKFFLVDKNGKQTAISFSELLNMKEPYGNDLLIQLYSTEGKFLLDVLLSENMLNSDFLMELGQNVANADDFTRGLTNKQNNRLPDTASPFGLYITAGLLLILFGTIIRKWRY